VKKFLDLTLLVERITVHEQQLLRIHLSKAVLRDWCLCLQLLQENLVEAFILFHNDASHKIEFRIVTAGRSSVKGDEARLEVSLASADLDFVRPFFLRYYRDNVAEVDHLDIETDNGGYITFSVEEFVPPVSAEEVRRRLHL
jgi:hypothetical protein